MEAWKIRLKQAREAKGLKKTAFAAAMGVAPATVTDWEKSVEDGGIKEVTGPNLTKMCEVLDITAQWLLNAAGEKPASSPELAQKPQPKTLRGPDEAYLIATFRAFPPKERKIVLSDIRDRAEAIERQRELREQANAPKNSTENSENHDEGIKHL